MRPDRTSPQIRSRLEELIAAYRVSYAALSRMLRRPNPWLRKLAMDERLHELSDEDRAQLARFFGVDEWELGGPGERRRA